MAQQQKFGEFFFLFILIQIFFKNHFLAYQAFRCYFFKVCKIAKFYLKFQYVAKKYKRILYFISLLPNLAKLSYG